MNAIETLREENKDLRRQLEEREAAEYLVSLQMAFDITRSQATVLATLLRKKVASRESLRAALYGHGNGPDSDKVIDVFVCHLRKKMPEGVKIKNAWAVGYTLPDESKAILRGMLG